MPDLGSEFLHGVETARAASDASQRLSLERQRLAQQHQQAQQQNEIAQQVQQRENLEQQARLQTQTAYRDAQISLEQQRVQLAAQVSAVRARDAAVKMADQHGFYQDLAGGMPVAQALFRHPHANPASAIAMTKDSAAIDAAKERLALANKNLQLRQREIQDRENNPGGVNAARETTTELYPPIKGNPAIPAVHHWFSPDDPAQPAVADQPARHVTRTIPVGLPSATVPPIVPSTNAPATPFGEGKVVRSKKDGKQYRITNGQPVPLADETQVGEP